MDEQIRIITQKLKELKRRDVGFQIFGADTHRYRNKGRLEEYEVKSFENRYNIHLPAEYREFLLQISNGGAGPYYGLESLEDGLLQDLDHREKDDLTNPSLEFPLSEAWNMNYWNIQDAHSSVAMEQEYYDNKWTNGLLRICNFGCGVSVNIVVNGKEYGNIWVDDRCNDGGIYPYRYSGHEERISFLTWYELWLDKSLKELDGQPEKNLDEPIDSPKPWWKTLLNGKKYHE